MTSGFWFFFAGMQKSGLNVPALFLQEESIRTLGGQGAEGAAHTIQPRQQVKHFQSRKGVRSWRHITAGRGEEFKVLHRLRINTWTLHCDGASLCLPPTAKEWNLTPSLCNFTVFFFFFAQSDDLESAKLEQLFLCFKEWERLPFLGCFFPPSVRNRGN